jgi:hypothetical protein
MSRRRARGEDGAVAVEAALITGVVFLIIFGILEFTFMGRDYVGVTSAARVGARIASTAADAGPCVAEPTDEVPCPTKMVPELAQQAADEIGRSVAALPKDDIEYVLVYKANQSGNPSVSRAVPSLAGCVSECVAYKWYPSQDRFRYFQGSWNSSLIDACATSRKSPDGSSGKLDTVGVKVVVDHKLLTGIFGGSMELSDHAVMKFEPLANKACAAGEHA